MSEPIKFTEPELKEVNSLQGTYVNIQNALGQLSISRIRLQQQIEEFDKAEGNLTKQFSETQEKEREFIDKINKKYGDGNLDINSGVFTPKDSTEGSTETK